MEKVRTATISTAIGVIGMLIVFGFVAGVVLEQWFYPQTVNVTTVELETRINNEVWSNGTTISWGSRTDGTYEYTMDVRNTGTTTTTVLFVVSELPEGITMSWAGNGTTLTPNTNVTAPLQLIIEEDVQVAQYNWQSWVRAT